MDEFHNMQISNYNTHNEPTATDSASTQIDDLNSLSFAESKIIRRQKTTVENGCARGVCGRAMHIIVAMRLQFI